MATLTPVGELSSTTSPAQPRPATDEDAGHPGRTNFLLAGFLVSVVTVALLILDERLWHWFVIPAGVCGVLVGTDVIGWLRGQFDIFDPRAMLAVLGLHFFYLAPMLHVVLDHWPPAINPSANWRDALGAMALLNAIGLSIYRYIVALPARRRLRADDTVRLNEKRFNQITAFGTAVGLTAFCVEVALFGGITGFLTTMTQGREILSGMGWLLLAAESFPMLTFILIVVRWRRGLAARRPLVILLLAGLAVVQFLVGGLRGSRSNTVWPVLLGLMLIHLLVVRISKKAMLTVALIMGSFMYAYGLYKSAGVDVVDIARGDRSVAEVSASTGRDLPTILLNDLSRADIQAVVLDRKLQGQGELGYGMSYLGDVSVLVPDVLLPVRPPSKVAFGTETLLGPGTYDYGNDQWVSRVYGIAGEAMLNFGPLGAVLSFVVLGMLMSWARTLYLRGLHGDGLVVKIIAPSLCLAAVLMLTSDLDNIMVVLLTRFVPPGLAVFLACFVVRSPLPGSANRGR